MVPNSSKFCLHDEKRMYGFCQVYHGRFVPDLNLFHCVSDLAAAFVQCVENALTRGKVPRQAWLIGTGSREVTLKAQRG